MNKLNLTDEELMQIAKETLHKMKSEKKTIKETLGVSEGLLEEMYSLAYGHYNLGHYKEAKDIFELIAEISPNTYKYVLGLASSLHQLKEYGQASLGFFIALHLQPENPLPAYYIADCFLKKDMKTDAKEFLDVTIELCQDPQYSQLKERCLLIKNSI